MIYVPHLLMHDKRFSEEQIEELKKEINKTDYEKAREPLVKDISKLEYENYKLKERIYALNNALRQIIDSIKDDYISIAVDTTIPKARFITNVREIGYDYSTFKTIKVPIKSDLIKDISRIICEEEKYK